MSQRQQSQNSNGGYVQPDPRQTQRQQEKEALRNPESRQR